ncbi:MAG TPA: ribosomal protein S18-alanine N-acetyltransferase [Gemmatimonadaceae bacterium]|nr:ribosomal protein S18-alanine N-acetyltransferase [Gemmatimonadaceae bacterium]
MSVAIRSAAGADLDSVLAIERESFSDPWSRASFSQLLDRPDALFAVAVTRDTRAGGRASRDGAPRGVAGYVVAWFVVDEAEIANLAVAGAHRRLGVGAALLDAALAAAHRRGARTVYLEVRDSNRAARELYASRGFTQVARRRNYYRRPVEDALVMSCDLRAAHAR